MTELDDLPLGNPARTALAAAGITTLGEAAARPRAEIAALHGVGPRALTVLDAALAERGLAFAESAPTASEPVVAAGETVPGQVVSAEPTTPYSPETYAVAPGPYAPYSAFAIVALVSAFVMPILGIIFGHLALRDIGVKGERGRELAIAGLVLGYVFSGVILLFVLLWIGTVVAIFGSVLWMIPFSTSFS